MFRLRLNWQDDDGRCPPELLEVIWLRPCNCPKLAFEWGSDRGCDGRMDWHLDKKVSNLNGGIVDLREGRENRQLGVADDAKRGESRPSAAQLRNRPEDEKGLTDSRSSAPRRCFPEWVWRKQQLWRWSLQTCQKLLLASTSPGARAGDFGGFPPSVTTG